MGYTVQGKCTSAVTPAVQCRPGRVHCVQVQDSLHLWAGGQREKKKSPFIIRGFKFNGFFFEKNKEKRMLCFNKPKTEPANQSGAGANLEVGISQALSPCSLGYLCSYFQRRSKKKKKRSRTAHQHRNRPGLIILIIIKINYYLIILTVKKKSVFPCGVLWL